VTPTPEEAAAIVAAVEALLAAERAAAAAPPLPAAYRSAWRRAALTPEPFAPAATEPP
jgi:hypothetical protein